MTTSTSISLFNNKLNAHYSTLDRRQAQLAVVFDLAPEQIAKFAACPSADLLLFAKREGQYRLATKMATIGSDIWEAPGTSLNRFLSQPLAENRAWAISRALTTIYNRHHYSVTEMEVYARLIELHVEYQS